MTDYMDEPDLFFASQVHIAGMIHPPLQLRARRVATKSHNSCTMTNPTQRYAGDHERVRDAGAAVHPAERPQHSGGRAHAQRVQVLHQPVPPRRQCLDDGWIGVLSSIGSVVAMLETNL